MKKNGFTLVELLAVIFIIGVLAAFVSLGVVSIFKVQKENALNAQITKIKEAAQLYINDCDNPSDSLLASGISCEGYIIDSSGNSTIYLEDLVSNKYIEEPSDAREKICSGGVLLETISGNATITCR